MNKIIYSTNIDGVILLIRDNRDISIILDRDMCIDYVSGFIAGKLYYGVCDVLVDAHDKFCTCDTNKEQADIINDLINFAYTHNHKPEIVQWKFCPYCGKPSNI